MDFMTSFKISASGLSAQRKRMNTISSNIANAETTRTPEGGPYKRKDVIFEAVPVSEFERTLKANGANEGSVVKAATVVEDTSPPKLVYNPKHPDADEQGYVALPNVNMMEEMVDMISASRAYEANAAVISASKSMAGRALDILRR